VDLFRNDLTQPQKHRVSDRRMKVSSGPSDPSSIRRVQRQMNRRLIMTVIIGSKSPDPPSTPRLEETLVNFKLQLGSAALVGHIGVERNVSVV